MLLHSVKMFAISRRLNHFVRLRSLAYAKYKMKTREELSAERREKHFNLIRSTITSALERRKSLSVTDWKSVVTELQKNSDIKNPIQLNKFILEALLSLRPPHDSLQNAKSCIEAFDIQHDLWTKRLLIQLYAKKASEVKLSSAEETEIIEMCNEFIAQEMHILPDMNSIVVAGICATKEWRRAFELEHLSSSSLNILMRKALRENEVEPTWVLFQTLLCSKKEFQFLSSKTINNFVKYFDRNPKDIPQNVDKLLTMCERIKKVFDAQSTEDLIRMLNKNGHHAEITTMNHSGKCGVCGNILEAAGITDKQFAILKDEFIKNVVNGKDIYLKTTPQEWKAFERTLQENGPFDIVMDGLNVAFLSNQLQNGVKFGNNKNRPCAHSLANAVAQLTNAGKRVLVVGRRHMARWPTIDYIKQMATLFLVDNISKDDIFLLYAAIHSGNNSYILSNDFMRQHKYAIGKKFDMLFKLWQQDHWYGFSSGNNQAIQLTKPMQFKMYTHKVGDFWHIPFKSREELESKTWNSYEMPKNWACIRIKQKM